MIVDFHSHTRHSDGSLDARDLVVAMRVRGVEVYSITDHDTLRAYGALDGTPPYGRLVVGIEINTTYRGNEVHVLGYRLPLGPSPLHDILEENREARRERVAEMVEGLRSSGTAITLEMVMAEAGGAESLGRPHVGKALVRRGFASSMETAFRNFLSKGKPGYVPSIHISPMDAIAVIRKAGGVAVLAHPGRLHDYELIDEMAAAGLDGLEVFYPTHDAAQRSYFRERARALKLVMSGGSDFHDSRWNTGGVGMDVSSADIGPFLERVLAP